MEENAVKRCPGDGRDRVEEVKQENHARNHVDETLLGGLAR
jgi:hypothetical protein